MAITYNSTPDGLLTYTSPSPKLCLQSSGVYQYQPHNLYLNSAVPANQSVTVVSEATYEIIITGSVSIAWSGAYTGTTTAGTTAFTAASGTLTGGSTSGSGTVSVRRTPSANTYIATTSAAKYNLPYEWDSSGSTLGIRVEEARTNLLVRSSALDNASWTANRATVTANATTGPNGVASAEKIVETAESGTHRIYYTVSKAASPVTYTLSCFFKAAERTFAQLRASESGGANLSGVAINLSTGEVGSTYGTFTSMSARSVNAGNGWWRLEFTFTTSSDTTITSHINVATSVAASSPDYVGDGTSGIYATGAQLEAGSFASSPIETFGSTVTRATDNISLATSAFPLGAEFTMMVEYAPFAIPPASAFLQCLSINDGTTNNQTVFTHRHTTGIGRMASSASAVTDVDMASTGGIPLTLNAPNRYVGAMAANNVGFSLNGSVTATDTSAAVPTATTLNIGSSVAAAALAPGWYSRILVVPRRVSDANLPTFGA